LLTPERRPLSIDLAVLVDRCRAGDELAWEAFVRQFQGRVYAIAGSYARTADQSRDLAQDIFVRLYEKRRLWPATEFFVPWMIRTARNLCIDHVRTTRARPAGVDDSEDVLARLPSGERDPEASWAGRRDQALVRRALGRLTAISREIILLRDIQGLSLEEVASLLHIPIGTIKSRSNRARLELARKLVDLGFRRETPSVP
jgi:RNA polymerase sigma-70 factor (ECF subfamily)